MLHDHILVLLREHPQENRHPQVPSDLFVVPILQNRQLGLPAVDAGDDVTGYPTVADLCNALSNLVSIRT